MTCVAHGGRSLLSIPDAGDSNKPV